MQETRRRSDHTLLESMTTVQGWIEAYNRTQPRMWVESPEVVKTKGLLGKMVSTIISRSSP
jgi:hypothetical protein